MSTTTYYHAHDCGRIEGEACDCQPEPKLLSKTEATRRLRAAAKLVRDTRHYPTNWRTEIGTRVFPVYSLDPGEARVLNHMTGSVGYGDDLVDMLPLSNCTAWGEEQALGEGYVVHLYFTSNGWDAELVDIVTVWTGTENHDPEIIH